MSVEIVGGPRDGDVVVLPDGTWLLRMPVMTDPRAWISEREPEPSAHLDVKVVEMSIKLTRNGYKAYWKEPPQRG